MVSTKCSSDTEYKGFLTGEAETQFICVGYKGTSRSRPSFGSVQSDAKVEEEDKKRNEVDQSRNAQERRDTGTVCRGTCRVSSSKKQAGRCGGEVEGLPHLPACCFEMLAVLWKLWYGLERNEVDQCGNVQERRDTGTVCHGTCRVSSSKKQAGRCGGEVEGLPRCG